MQPTRYVQVTANPTFLAFPHCPTPSVGIHVTPYNSIQTMNGITVALYTYQKLRRERNIHALLQAAFQHTPFIMVAEAVA
jgi:N-acetyl-gamma-glutamylphosphate reductase